MSPDYGLSDSTMPRVLLVDSDLASRLTLQTLLKTAGYVVESVAEYLPACSLLQAGEYNLVLSDPAGQAILEYARKRENAPATARINSVYCIDNPDQRHQILLDDRDISRFLDHVAELIGRRTTRRLNERRLWQMPPLSPIC